MLKFTREEVESLIRVLRWVDTATLSGEEAKRSIKETAMKLQIALKETPENLKEIKFQIGEHNG